MIHSLSNFQPRNTVLLPLDPMLYISSPKLTYLITESLTQSPHLAHFLALPKLFYSLSSGFFHIPHISEITPYLPFSVWLISLSVTSHQQHWHYFLSFWDCFPGAPLYVQNARRNQEDLQFRFYLKVISFLLLLSGCVSLWASLSHLSRKPLVPLSGTFSLHSQSNKF